MVDFSDRLARISKQGDAARQAELVLQDKIAFSMSLEQWQEYLKLFPEEVIQHVAGLQQQRLPAGEDLEPDPKRPKLGDVMQQKASYSDVYNSWSQFGYTKECSRRLVDELDHQEDFESWLESHLPKIADLPELTLLVCKSEKTVADRQPSYEALATMVRTVYAKVIRPQSDPDRIQVMVDTSAGSTSADRPDLVILGDCRDLTDHSADRDCLHYVEVKPTDHLGGISTADLHVGLGQLISRVSHARRSRKEDKLRMINILTNGQSISFVVIRHCGGAADNLCWYTALADITDGTNGCVNTSSPAFTDLLRMLWDGERSRSEHEQLAKVKQLQLCAQTGAILTSGTQTTQLAIVSSLSSHDDLSAVYEVVQLGCIDPLIFKVDGKGSRMNQVAKEAAILQHLGPCPPCLPQLVARPGQVGICEEGGRLRMLPGVLGLLTRHLGTDVQEMEVPLAAAEIMGLTRSLLQAIAFLEAKLCCHNDIAPRNIIRRSDAGDTGEAQYALVDLGTATCHAPAFASQDNLSHLVDRVLSSVEAIMHAPPTPGFADLQMACNLILACAGVKLPWGPPGQPQDVFESANIISARMSFFGEVLDGKHISELPDCVRDFVLAIAHALVHGGGVSAEELLQEFDVVCSASCTRQ